MKGFRKKLLPIILTFITVTSLTVISMFYAMGYRVSVRNPGDPGNGDSNGGSGPITINKTGILAVRSIPDSAKIYLNGELRDVTNSTITSLAPGEYNLRVEKEGYEVWEKDIEVYQDLVTDVTASLVLKGGGLNPLTSAGVKEFSLSNSGEMLAYLSSGEEKPGLWAIQLSNSPLNIFQTSKKVIAADHDGYIYSSGEEIYWSPNDQEVLVKINDRGYYLVDLSRPATQVPVSYSDPSEVFLRWNQREIANKQANVEALEIPLHLQGLAILESSVWSPDGEKFFNISTEDRVSTVRVYNFEDPLPVGEKRYYDDVRFPVEENYSVYWYSDSKHLILSNSEKIKLVNVDGGNMFEIFSGSVLEGKAYPSPSGNRVIILSKFKTDAPENLYTVSIR